jgi:hypothetical protein
MNAPTSFYWSLIVYPLFPIDAKRVPADFEAFQQRTISGYCRKTCFGEVSDRSFGRFVGNAEVGFLLAGCRAGRERFNRSVSQVKFRLLQILRSCHSLTNDRPIMLALKKFIPCNAAALCIKTPSALLAA